MKNLRRLSRELKAQVERNGIIPPPPLVITPAIFLKSFIAKRVISILVNLRYLRDKRLKYKENDKKMYNTFDHLQKYTFIYEKGIIRKVLVCIMRWCPYFKNVKNGA